MSRLFTRFVQIGRVVLINYGADINKLATIIDVVDGNRVVIDGPTTGVKRQVINLKRVALTQFVVPVARGIRSGKLTKAVETFDLKSKWATTSTSKAISARSARANMNDFDRFKAMVARRKRSTVINTELKALKKKAAAK